MTMRHHFIGPILPEPVSVSLGVMLICQSRPESQIRSVIRVRSRSFRATKPVQYHPACMYLAGKGILAFCFWRLRRFLLSELDSYVSPFILLIRARRCDMATPAPAKAPAAKRSLPLRSRSGCLTCRTKHVRPCRQIQP